MSFVCSDQQHSYMLVLILSPGISGMSRIIGLGAEHLLVVVLLLMIRRHAHHHHTRSCCTGTSSDIAHVI